jgi:hypothetical protein
MKSLVNNLKDALSEPRNDGILHFSQHLQHDRHTVLYMEYGYPKVVQAWGRVFPLVQGTGVHETVHTIMSGLYPKYVPEFEIRADDSFQFSWGGTADAYVEDHDGSVWLIDYKTISGPGVEFLEDEPKEDHIWQVSAYYHFGPTQACKTGVLYLPSSAGYKRDWAEPRFLPFEPLERDTLINRMLSIEEAISLYRTDNILPEYPEGSYSWKKKGKKYELLYRPHYTSMFCPWASLDDDPCKCSNQTQKIVAKWSDDTLDIEAGYDIIVETIGLPDEISS